MTPLLFLLHMQRLRSVTCTNLNFCSETVYDVYKANIKFPQEII